MPSKDTNGSAKTSDSTEANKGSSKKIRPTVAVLAALSGVPFIMVLGNSMIIPVLPDIKNSLNLTQFEVSLIITLFSVPAGIIIPLAGFLSDHYGRRAVIVPALVIYGLGGVVAALGALYVKQYTFAVILAGRVLQGIGAAGTAPIAMALTGDLFKGKERSKTLGVIEAANGFGKVVSPVLGAAIGLIAWYAAFIFFPFVVIPIVLGILFLIKEPNFEKSKQGVGEYFGSIKKIFEKKAAILLASFLAGMVALLILFGVLFFLSEYLEKTYNLKGIKKGLALAVPVLFMTVTSFTTGLLIKKKYNLMKWLIVGGLAIIAVSIGSMGLTGRNTILFFVAISLSGVGTGLALPCLNTIITSATESSRRGMITSLYGSVRFFGVAVGPPAFGLLMTTNQNLMFWGAASLSGVASLVALFFIKVKDMGAGNAQSKKQGHQETVPAKVEPFKVPPAVPGPALKPLPQGAWDKEDKK